MAGSSGKRDGPLADPFQRAGLKRRYCDGEFFRDDTKTLTNNVRISTKSDRNSIKFPG